MKNKEKNKIVGVVKDSDKLSEKIKAECSNSDPEDCCKKIENNTKDRIDKKEVDG